MQVDRNTKPPLVVYVAVGLICISMVYWLSGLAATSTAQPTRSRYIPAAAFRPAATLVQFLSEESGAKCLDGSPPAYYIRHGSGTGKHKWIVMFEGGGWCYDLEQCYLRSKTTLGSSKMYPDVLSEDDMRFYISHNPEINPHMHNWNTVLVRYCDGSSFAGNAEHLHKVTVHSCSDLAGYAVTKLHAATYS
jgi:hypothetical protein